MRLNGFDVLFFDILSGNVYRTPIEHATIFCFANASNKIQGMLSYSKAP